MECDITKTAEYQLGRMEARVRLAIEFLECWEPETLYPRERLISILTDDETLPWIFRQSDAQ